MASRLKTKAGVLVVAAIAAAAVGILLLKPSDKQAVPNNAGNTTQTAPETQQVAYTGQFLEASDYKYPRPAGWAKLSKEVLTAVAADSGIGYTGQNVTFTVQTSSSTPANDNDLKNSTLEVLKKLSQFNLQGSSPTMVDGATGQKFIFTAANEAGKFKKEMSVVINKKKTYFLLSAAPEESYSKHQADLNVIIANFKFK